jgi:hypothetical protein
MTFSFFCQFDWLGFVAGSACVLIECYINIQTFTTVNKPQDGKKQRKKGKNKTGWNKEKTG